MPQSNVARRDIVEQQNAARKPAEKFHDGSVHVSIWQNEGVNGAFRTATFQLRYKDSNQQWQTGTSYGLSDLQHLETAAKEARARIENWQKDTKPAPKPPA